MLSGCSDYLDQKPNQSLVIPKSLADFRALLDNDIQTFNTVPGGLVFASDELKITEQGLNSLSNITREYYLWDRDAFLATEFVGDWNRPYGQVFVSNIVLEGLEKFGEAERSGEWHEVRGQALFSRAFAIYNLLQLFAAPYDSSKSDSDLGLPYPNSSDITLRFDRETVAVSYGKIIRDLIECEKHLPETIEYASRPSKAAANMMLAKIYLNMSDFENVKLYANKAIGLKSDLMDYNMLDPKLIRPFPEFNVEIIYNASQLSIGQTSTQIFFDDLFLDLYGENDLRPKLFFLTNGFGLVNFKGSYSAGNFGGLAVDELYFILAEAELRTGQVEQAASTLNVLLKTRFHGEEYSPVIFEDQLDALKTLHREKLKQLVFRGTRWSDLRRLKSEGDLSGDLVKNVGGKEFTLNSNDPRWTYPIPFGEISNHPIPQNPK
ncbi:hypothetical protein P872_12630 [Rhodonellum psychrophilum GCM71 = DSM 17998]|uniref:Glycan metabolism protein RagB n=2 Tax=Rhodonellum TaxID=336827 RepID=U5BRU2_9BACT|nr:hypothetical protein P872_12630 [Rhodonellum psychrophilum GCM71 = DSM 17998]